ncbi:MAG TPA: amidohydrolase family protein [Pyrinomonadaceae bacterium]|jgi:imidazolonepropionase-like amidohydrolase|nr:amidohydrolase family protein [Pyrinomonadaceae bacterium]
MKKNIWNAFFSAAVFVLLLFAVVSESFAQYRTSTYAVTNARIVTGTGSVIEKGTIVVRDGLIAQVGENVTAPADARVIDGTGLTIYPGFFDANSNIGIAAAQRPGGAGAPGGGGQAAAASAAAAAASQQQSNSNYPYGLRPETEASNLVVATDASFETFRNNGITTALSVPRDGIFMGESALLNTAGDSVSAMIVRAPFAQHITFRTLGGGGVTASYPTSLMGTFSALRQMLLDAQRLQEMKRIYAAGPRGVRRPEADKSLEALIPVLNREVPIVINANSEREIIRALDLGKEFNLKLIIAGGMESGKVADRLKKQDVPVLLSLNFPKRTASSSAEADPESMETLRLRAEAPKNAGILAAAGVKFAFQSGGMTNMSDFLANAGKTTENGLAKDAAIRALTMSPAEIFGVADRLGSLEAGKIANFVALRGDVFGKDRQLTHVFVDGAMYEQKPPEKPAAGRPGGPGGRPGTETAAAPLNLAGTWRGSIDAPGNQIDFTLTLVQQGTVLTGTAQSAFGTSEIKNSELTADGFRFEIIVSFNGQNQVVSFSGKVTGNQMTGQTGSPQGSFPFTGTRNP